MCEPNDLYLRVFMFWFVTEKALFQVSLYLFACLERVTVGVGDSGKTKTGSPVVRVCTSGGVYVPCIHLHVR